MIMSTISRRTNLQEFLSERHTLFQQCLEKKRWS